MKMKKSDFYEKALKIMKRGYVCDHCLGRQFAQLLSGLDNSERGKSLRNFFAMLIDSGEKIDADISNFSGYNFRFTNIKSDSCECTVCNDFFENMGFFVRKIEKKLDGIEFNNFLIGTKLNSQLIRKEENIWEEVGIEWCEPLKAEINRVLGRKIEKKMNKQAEFQKPEIMITVDVSKKDVKIDINSLYIYGEYNKLVRNLPQTRWPSGKYKNSVEQIVAKPVIKMAKGEGSKFHGAGREDIDAKCLAWRPFVLEITKPIKRKLKVSEIRKSINKSKKVQIKKVKIVDKSMVEKVKSIRPDKTYRAVVKTKKEANPKDLKKIKNLSGKKIFQETPQRVLHRRADKLRKRTVKKISYKKLSKHMIELRIKAEAGTYIKEFVSGDSGRTYPSVSEMIGTDAVVRKLDVVKIHHEL